jgi:hypothetical protein
MKILTYQEHDALLEFKREHGYHWKHELRNCWMSCQYPGIRKEIQPILHQLRNASYFGPSGLIRFTFNPRKGS